MLTFSSENQKCWTPLQLPIWRKLFVVRLRLVVKWRQVAWPESPLAFCDSRWAVQKNQDGQFRKIKMSSSDFFSPNASKMPVNISFLCLLLLNSQAFTHDVWRMYHKEYMRRSIWQGWWCGEGVLESGVWGRMLKTLEWHLLLDFPKLSFHVFFLTTTNCQSIYFVQKYVEVSDYKWPWYCPFHVSSKTMCDHEIAELSDPDFCAEIERCPITNLTRMS